MMQMALAKMKCILHHTGMRTHASIIKDTSAQTVHDRLGFTDKLHTVRSWQQRDSIPAEFWKAFDDAGLATLDELAKAAAERKAPDTQTASAA